MTNGWPLSLLRKTAFEELSTWQLDCQTAVHSSRKDDFPLEKMARNRSILFRSWIMGQFFQHSFNHLTSNVIMHPTGFTFSRDDQTPSKTAINFSCRNYETMICDSFNGTFGILLLPLYHTRYLSFKNSAKIYGSLLYIRAWYNVCLYLAWQFWKKNI